MNPPYSTADLFDRFEADCVSCETQFRLLGGRPAFHGRIATVECHRDNLLVRRQLERPGEGRVLVVDGGGALGSALLGDKLADLGRQNGWAGAIINGAVRDVLVLAKVDFGVAALGSNPRKSAKLGAGRIDVPVTFGAATFTPGHWVYCDADGVLISARRLADG